MKEINWHEVFEKYKQLDSGSKALLKRASTLKEIQNSIVLFQLGLQLNTQCSRVAFCLPFLNSVKDGCSLGSAIGRIDDGDIGLKKDKYSTIGKRLMRVVRLDSNDDLYEFRRLLRFLASKSDNKEINVDLIKTCNSLYYWSQVDRNSDRKTSKEQIFENYLIEKYSD